MSDFSKIAEQALTSARTMAIKFRPHLAKTTFVMGGDFHIDIVGEGNELMNSTIELLADLERKWSRFLPDSEISRLNWAEGQALKVSDETLLLVEKLIEGWNATGGLFDPTTLPRTIANGYAQSHSDASRITSLPVTATWPGDVAGIVLNREKHLIKLPLGTTLDGGGLGKGLAADLAVEHIMKNGALGAMVNANGDVRVSGDSPDGNAWRIGIEHPMDAKQEIAQVQIVDGAIVTSSRVHKVWDGVDGSTHHLINPKSGLSAQTKVLTTTVISATSAQGEVLAKLPFFLTLEDAFNEISILGAQACVIDEDMVMHTTTGWQDYQC